MSGVIRGNRLQGPVTILLSLPGIDFFGPICGLGEHDYTVVENIDEAAAGCIPDLAAVRFPEFSLADADRGEEGGMIVQNLERTGDTGRAETHHITAKDNLFGGDDFQLESPLCHYWALLNRSTTSSMVPAI